MKTHLVFGTITIILLLIVISTRRQESFSYQRVVDMAEDMARNGYLSGSPAVPKVLRELNYDQLRDIRWRDDKTLWRREALPFQVRFFLPGGGHLDHSVEIYQVEGDRAEPVPFRRDFFRFREKCRPGGKGPPCARVLRLPHSQSHQQAGCAGRGCGVSRSIVLPCRAERTQLRVERAWAGNRHRRTGREGRVPHFYEVLLVKPESLRTK